MYSTLLKPQQIAGFGRFLTQLGGLVLLGLAVWAGLFAAAIWQNEQRLQPGVVAAANVVQSPPSTEYSVLSTGRAQHALNR